MPSKDKDDAAVAAADRRHFFAAIFAHGGARVLSKVASAPLERVKICLQVSALPQQSLARSGFGRVSALCGDILVRQGPVAFWRGFGAHMLGTGLGGVARLSVLRTSQMWAMPGGERHYQGLGSYARRCAFIYLAGSIALLVAYPLDVAYTCLAADSASPRSLRGALHFARQARRQHGLLSLYRGFPLCLAAAGPFVAVATAVHDLLAPVLLRRRGQAPQVVDLDPRSAQQPMGPLWLARDAAPVHLYPWNLLVGAASGFTGQAATYPLDTLRRRWQRSCAGPREEAPRTLRECAQRALAEDGWRGLYAGFGVNALKLLPELLVLSGAYLAINASSSFV